MQEWPVVPIERFWTKGNRHEVVKARVCGGEWRISDLREAVKDEPVFDLPLCCIDLGSMDFDGNGGLISFARHMRHVLEADLDYPVILDEWGQVIDGRHRIVKALVEEKPTVKAVKVSPGIHATGRAP